MTEELPAYRPSSHDGSAEAGVPAWPIASSRLVLLVAWIAVVLGSALTHIVWVAGLGYNDNPLWDYIGRLCGLGVLFLFSWYWPKLRPLRGFLLAILAFNVAIDGVIFVSSLPQVHALPPALYALVNALLAVAFSVALMALTLFRSGLSRRDLFLAKGEMRARTHLPRPWYSSVRWTLFGPLALGLLVIPAIVELVLEVHPDFALASHILSSLPIVVAFGIINAAQEEFTYRMVYLARLTPVIGVGQALLLTSVNFGLNHWVGGHPNGLAGAVTVALLGFILGKSMLETRGIAWAWILHTCADVMVSIFLVMQVVPH